MSVGVSASPDRKINWGTGSGVYIAGFQFS